VIPHDDARRPRAGLLARTLGDVPAARTGQRLGRGRGRAEPDPAADVRARVEDLILSRTALSPAALAAAGLARSSLGHGLADPVRLPGTPPLRRRRIADGLVAALAAFEPRLRDVRVHAAPDDRAGLVDMRLAVGGTLGADGGSPVRIGLTAVLADGRLRVEDRGNG
jgi:predicted component of type VI protein secretion system